MDVATNAHQYHPPESEPDRATPADNTSSGQLNVIMKGGS